MLINIGRGKQISITAIESIEYIGGYDGDYVVRMISGKEHFVHKTFAEEIKNAINGTQEEPV